MSAVHHADAYVMLKDEAGTKVGEFHRSPRKNTAVDNTIALKNGKHFPITVASYTAVAYWNSATLKAISFKCIGPSSYAMTATCLASYPSTSTYQPTD